MTNDVWWARNTDQNDPIVRDGKAYSTQYHDQGDRMDIAAGQKRLFGAADRSKMDKYTDLVTRGESYDYVDRFYTVASNAAFVPDYPVAQVEFLGDRRSSKAWNFIVDTL